jgi:fructose-1,6-bisphosphatase/sedoheptulose 1,7-bisphosphatase-like protein
VAVTETELHNGIEYQQSLVRKHEAVIYAKTEEIEKLEEKMLQQAEEIHKLNPQSMYAFSFHVVS